jgi:hypothetical protein
MKVVWLVAVVLGLAAGHSSAQDRTFAIEGTGGYVGFADDGIVGHSLIGAAARWYVLPRISIGPEIQFMAGRGDHSDLMVTGNVTVDLIERRAGHRAIPFQVVGGGLFQTRNPSEATPSPRAREGSRLAAASASSWVTASM